MLIFGGAHLPTPNVEQAADTTGCYVMYSLLYVGFIQRCKRLMCTVCYLQEMNPASASFKVVLDNPIAYAAFKSTEPWLLEYMALDLGELAQRVGFAHCAETNSTPSHKTFIACKQN